MLRCGAWAVVHRMENAYLVNVSGSWATPRTPRWAPSDRGPRGGSSSPWWYIPTSPSASPGASWWTRWTYFHQFGQRWVWKTSSQTRWMGAWKGMAMRQDVEFDAEGVTLRGWLYLPDGASGPPVVMAHGFSAVKETYLDSFAAAFELGSEDVEASSAISGDRREPLRPRSPSRQLAAAGGDVVTAVAATGRRQTARCSSPSRCLGPFPARAGWPGRRSRSRP
jgi:hypothetical protein